MPPIDAKASPRNRLGKVLPEEWRMVLADLGVPRRKYTALCRATLSDGRVIEELIVEEAVATPPLTAAATLGGNPHASTSAILL